MDKDQEEVRFALGILDDYRRLIAAGKTQRWDVLKWAVTINTTLTAASIALRQQSVGTAGRGFLLLVFLVAVLGACLVAEVNRRMANTRRGSRKPERFLSEHGIAISKIAETGVEVSWWCDFWHDRQELAFYGVVLFASILPALLLWWFWNSDLSKMLQI